MKKVYNLTVNNFHTYFVGVSGVLGHNGCYTPTFTNGSYERHFKHANKPRQTNKGKSGAAPTNPQRGLDESIPLSPNTTRRVAIDKENGEYLIFDEHAPGKFHGHSRAWKELDNAMQAALRNSGLVLNNKGKMK